jgi:beta-lactamase class A
VEPQLRPHIMLLDAQTLEWAGYREQGEVSSASVIKLPLLYLYALHVNAGTLDPMDFIHYAERHRVSGSGRWQFQGVNQYFTGFQTAEAMIQSSDNSATEMMIDLLGGKNSVNQQLEALGLQETRLRETLPDLNGYNTISPYEMVGLLLQLKEHPIFSEETRAMILGILEGTHNRGLIPALLPKETLVAHKTGDIGKSLGEAALVYLPDGRTYYLAVMVERSHNDYNAKTFIQTLSKAIWDDYMSHTSAMLPLHQVAVPTAKTPALPTTNPASPAENLSSSDETPPPSVASARTANASAPVVEVF